MTAGPSTPATIEQPPHDEQIRGAWVPRQVLQTIHVGEDILHLATGIVLFALAAIVLVRTVVDFFQSDLLFPVGVTQAVNDVLFVIILMEIMRTVVAHFTDRHFQLKPFLAIGIISAVRHILTIGSSLTLAEGTSHGVFERTIEELVVNTGVAVLLVVGLVLLRRWDED